MNPARNTIKKNGPTWALKKNIPKWQTMNGSGHGKHLNYLTLSQGNRHNMQGKLYLLFIWMKTGKNI